MIILLRSTEGRPDSRFEKYIDFLNRKNYSYLSICWDRSGKEEERKHNLFFKRKANYGGGIKNIISLLIFNLFIFINLFKLRKDCTVIHACDFDTILPALLFKILFKKTLIYDIFDYYIDSREISNNLLKFLVRQAEVLSIKYSDAVIICEEERKEQLPLIPDNLWILPNIPNFSQLGTCSTLHAHPLSIAYVGVFAPSRGLEKLVKVIKKFPSIIFNVAGFGQLESIFDDVKGLPNVNFYGKVDYVIGLEIMRSSSLIYAVYETDNPNHLYAAPNKYYEGLYLGKPIITTKGTLVGDKTSKFDTGYTLIETYEDLQNLLASLSELSIHEKAINASKLWNQKYSTFFESFMIDKYSTVL